MENIKKIKTVEELKKERREGKHGKDFTDEERARMLEADPFADLLTDREIFGDDYIDPFTGRPEGEEFDE